MEAIASNGEIIKTGDAVLVRDTKDSYWTYSIFSHKINNNPYPYITCCSGNKECIPYKDNESFVGTNKDFENTFEFKFGKKVSGITSNDITVEGNLIGYNEKDRNTPYLVRTTKSQGHPTNGVMFWCKSIEYI